MRRSTVGILLLALVGCAPAAPVARTDRAAADSVLALIRARGARHVLDSMFRDRGTDDRWSDAIATGDSVWLRVARELRSESDAGMSESLDIALAYALPRAPARVLHLLEQAPFSIDWVCGSPFIEAPDTLVANHRRRAIEAVSAVSDTALAKQRVSCLGELQRH